LHENSAIRIFVSSRELFVTTRQSESKLSIVLAAPNNPHF